MAKKYSPNNANAQLLLENVGTAFLLAEASKQGWPSNEERHKYPHLDTLFKQMTNLQLQTDIMGYEEMPHDAYQRWIKSINLEKQKRSATK